MGGSVGISVDVAVGVGVGTDVSVAVGVAGGMDVFVAVGDGIGVSVGTTVGVGVAGNMGVAVGKPVGEGRGEGWYSGAISGLAAVTAPRNNEAKITPSVTPPNPASFKDGRILIRLLP